MDNAYLVNDIGCQSSQEGFLSENEYQLIKTELPDNILDDITLFTEDNKEFMLKKDLPLSKQHEPNSLPQKMPKSPTSSLPCTEDWAGPYEFELMVDSSTCTKKTWLYSYSLNKVFIDKFKTIPLQFKITFSKEEEPFFVRALPIYTVAQHMSLPVNRCLVHLKEEQEKGFMNIEHVVRCEEQNAFYDFDRESKRYSVVVPLGSPQPGCDFVTHMYSLTCKTSCCGGMNRRPIMIVFTLEKGQEVVGRKTLNLRICSCPKRDKEKEEKLALEANGEGLHQPSHGKRPMDLNDGEPPRSSLQSKKRKSSPSNEEKDLRKKVYNVKVVGYKNYVKVLKLLKCLSSDEHYENPSEEVRHIREEYSALLEAEKTAVKGAKNNNEPC